MRVSLARELNVVVEGFRGVRSKAACCARVQLIRNSPSLQGHCTSGGRDLVDRKAVHLSATVGGGGHGARARAPPRQGRDPLQHHTPHRLCVCVCVSE